MKTRFLSVLSLMVCLLIAPLAAQQPAAAPQTEPAPAKPADQPEAKPGPYPNLMDRISYVIGWTMGMNFRRDQIEINLDVLLAGLKDGVANNPSVVPEQEARESMAALQKQLQDKTMEEQKQAAAKNREEGNNFLEANKAKPGVQTLPSGLQYKVITEGTGATPAASDNVMVNYRGTLIDGKEFDSSYKRGEPAKFPVSGLIPGVSEALQLMKVGSKWEIYVPADLAYGDQQAGPDIGPGSTLIFEVEMLSIVPPEKPVEEPPAKGEPTADAKLPGGKTVEFKDPSGKVQSVQMKEMTKEEVAAMEKAAQEKAAQEKKQPPKDQPPK
jgi:FKBP-type peptidyl-prolyl cis-trans isomerase FklB